MLPASWDAADPKRTSTAPERVTAAAFAATSWAALRGVSGCCQLGEGSGAPEVEALGVGDAGGL